MNTPVEILCRYLPIEFATFLNYCRDLYFIEKPDYNCLRQSFRKLFFRKYSNTNSNLFDWTILANKSSSSSGKMIKEYKIDSSQEQKNTSRKDPKSKDTKLGDKFKHRYDYPHADTPQDKHSVKVLEIATYI